MSASCPAIMIFPEAVCRLEEGIPREGPKYKRGGPNNFVADVFLGHLIPTGRDIDDAHLS
jgi:hypothetical protein